MTMVARTIQAVLVLSAVLVVAGAVLPWAAADMSTDGLGPTCGAMFGC
jgi:hypothetical protein